MSQIIVTATETFGPFSTVEILEDRYLCDGELGLPFAVLGAATVQDAAGYTPPSPPPEVPDWVDILQAELALINIGKLSLVQPAIDALPEPTRSQANAYWRRSSRVYRHDAITITIAQAIGLSSDDTDTLFINAKAL